MTILIAEDDPVARRMLEAIVQSWGYTTRTARDGVEALEIILGDSPPVLAIIDWMMPRLDGLALCHQRQLAAQSPHSTHYVYMIMLTSRSAKTEMVAALAAGADDYVVKPYDVNELQARVRAGMRIQQLQKSLRMLATRDALTGLWNRRCILESLQREIERRDRVDEALTVMMIDVDWFKKINDTHGHLVGDEMLAAAAATLQAGSRSIDLLGRYGGEEFLAVLPATDAEMALSVGERLRSAVSMQPYPSAAGPIAMTVSIGIASYARGQSTSSIEAIAAADAALYQAKALGRNGVALAGPASPRASPALAVFEERDGGS